MRINIDNYRKNYFRLRKIINELLIPYNDNDFTEDPSVDIDKIALENGIKGILLVKPKEINKERAVLDVDKGVIKLDKKDSLEERRFSIAHDLKHYILRKQEYYKKQVIQFKQPYIVAERAEVQRKISRYSNRNLLGVINLRYNSYFRFLSKYVEEVVSFNLGKPVTRKSAKRVLKKIYYDYYNKHSKKDVHKYVTCKKFITDAINRLYDEETADYFAANMLVPTERFILWEDRSDREIAKAFKVPIRCIKKRREEALFETDFTTIKDIF